MKLRAIIADDEALAREGLRLLLAEDPDIELEGSQVKMAILVEANDPDKAIAEASPVLRQAIHDAGGSTPDWPENNWKAWSVRKVTLSVRPVELVAA